MTIFVSSGASGQLPQAPRQYGAAVWNGTWWESDYASDSVDICAEFGVSTSATDNSSAINSALSTLGPLGLRCFVRPGTYTIQNPIIIGNGTTSALSSWSGRLVGGGVAPWSGYGSSGVPGVKLLYTGASGLNQMVLVAGPVVGWELSNVCLDGGGGGSAPTWALQEVSGQRGRSVGLCVQGCINGIRETATGTTPLQSLALHNQFEQPAISWIGSSGQNYGLRFDSLVPNYSDPCYTEVRSPVLAAPITSLGGTRNAMAFQVCDNVRVVNAQFFGNPGGSDGINAIVFDYSANAAFPNDCFIGPVDLGGQAVVNVGSPSVSTPNRIVAISRGNGYTPNPSLANLDWGYSNASP